MVAVAPFPLPPGASVSCRGQCCAVLCGGEGGRGWGAGCGVSPIREMPATVYARGLATKLEKCEVRRIVNHEERKQARQKLRNERYARACANLLPPHYKSDHVHGLSVEEQWEWGYGGVQQAQAIQADEVSKEAAIRAANSEKQSACSAAAGHEAKLKKKIRRGGYGARGCQRTENHPRKIWT